MITVTLRQKAQSHTHMNAIKYINSWKLGIIKIISLSKN